MAQTPATTVVPGVKRILLIEDGRPFWPRIKDLLTKVNGVVDEQLLGELPPTGAGRKPDMVVVGENYYASRPAGWWDGALLILEKGRAAELVTPIEGTRERQVFASSGISERGFLTLSSRLLGVSERRQFCAVIGVRRAGQEHVRMGASREFSLTGLSFSLAEDFQPGERCEISFYIPGARRRAMLEAEVVRSFVDPEDRSACHGARFVGLSGEDRDVLKQFVWAEG